jgi:hypothetical protein
MLGFCNIAVADTSEAMRRSEVAAALMKPS